jgi:hypothetical protein
MTTYAYHCVIDRLFEQAAIIDERTFNTLSSLMDDNPTKFHAIRLVIIESADPLSRDELLRRLALLCYS